MSISVLNQNRFEENTITEEELSLYGEVNGWEASWCVKEAVRVFESDYTATYNGNKYILDLHIKAGIKSQQLIRIYFCWAEDLNKVLIGSMPEHLRTSK